MSDPVGVWNVFLFEGAVPCTCEKQGVLDMLEAEMERDNITDEFRVVPKGAMTRAEYEALPEWSGP